MSYGIDSPKVLRLIIKLAVNFLKRLFRTRNEISDEFRKLNELLERKHWAVTDETLIAVKEIHDIQGMI